MTARRSNRSSSVRAPADIALVHSVVRALYEPWLDASARHFQSRVDGAESVARGLVWRHQEREGRVRLFRRRAPLRRRGDAEGTAGSEGPASSARSSPRAPADGDGNGQAALRRLYTTPSTGAQTLSTSTRSYAAPIRRLPRNGFATRWRSAGSMSSVTRCGRRSSVPPVRG